MFLKNIVVNFDILEIPNSDTFFYKIEYSDFRTAIT